MIIKRSSLLGRLLKWFEEYPRTKRDLYLSIVSMILKSIVTVVVISGVGFGIGSIIDSIVGVDTFGWLGLVLANTLLLWGLWYDIFGSREEITYE